MAQGAGGLGAGVEDPFVPLVDSSGGASAWTARVLEALSTNTYVR